jgi:hypothetical protein
MNQNIVFLLILLVLGSCSFEKKEQKGDDHFYDTRAGWDINHVPVFPPYRMTSTYPDIWLLNGKGPIKTSENSVLKRFYIN